MSTSRIWSAKSSTEGAESFALIAAAPNCKNSYWVHINTWVIVLNINVQLYSRYESKFTRETIRLLYNGSNFDILTNLMARWTNVINAEIVKQQGWSFWTKEQALKARHICYHKKYPDQNILFDSRRKENKIVTQ